MSMNIPHILNLVKDTKALHIDNNLCSVLRFQVFALQEYGRNKQKGETDLPCIYGFQRRKKPCTIGDRAKRGTELISQYQFSDFASLPPHIGFLISPLFLLILVF